MANGQTTRPTKRTKKRGRREDSLRGTGLYRDPRTDILYWRRTDPHTGKREAVSTGTTVLEEALKVAQDREDARRQKKAGINTYSDWTKPLAPLVAEWIKHQESASTAPGESWISQQRGAVERALIALKLDTAGDLTDLSKIEARLRALGLPLATARRRYQNPLRQFSAWLAGNHRHLDRDPLASWEPIEYEPEERHRAFMPDEVARALTAAEWLDKIHGRKNSLRVPLLVLLVTAPRKEALCSREVAHYDRDDRRIDYGAGCGRKGRGQGKLDDATAAELETYLGDRKDGPLFLGPRGGGLDGRNLFRWWREAFGLGVVWSLWPAGVPWTIKQGHLVNQALLTGRASVRETGNANADTRRDRARRDLELKFIADDLREEWAAQMERVTVHAFRHTAETWARASGVDQVLINLQGGWAVAKQSIDTDALRVASAVGLSRYLDTRSPLLDARPVAVAIRGLLDGARRGLAAEQCRRSG